MGETPRSSPWLPVAVVFSGALIGAGLFFGLRQRSPDPARVEVVALSASDAPPGASLTSQRVAAMATAAVALHTAMLRTRCAHVLPSDGGVARVVLDITFDAGGLQLARGILEDRTTPSAGVGACVNDALPALQVPAPGVTTRVEVGLVLP